MEETGKVIAVNPDTITVSMKRTSACARCGACISLASTDEMRIEVRNDGNAQVNDRVQVSLPSDAFLTAALVLYGLPLAGFLTGCGLGAWVGVWLGLGTYGGLVAFGAGLALAGAAYGVIKRLEPRWRGKGFAPRVTKVHKE